MDRGVPDRGRLCRMCWGVIPGSRPNGSACRRPSGPAGGPGRSLARRRGILRVPALPVCGGGSADPGVPDVPNCEVLGYADLRTAAVLVCRAVPIRGHRACRYKKKIPSRDGPGFFCRELRIKPVRPNPGRFRICACRASSARRGPGPGICGGRTLRAGLRRSCGWLRSWPDGRPSRC